MPIATPSALHLADLRGQLGISRESLARLLDVSAKSIERWEGRGTLPVGLALRQRLAQLHEVAALAQAVFEADGARAFVRTPLPALAGRTPLQAIAAGEGERVLAVLATFYEGAAV